MLLVMVREGWTVVYSEHLLALAFFLHEKIEFGWSLELISGRVAMLLCWKT